MRGSRKFCQMGSNSDNVLRVFVFCFFVCLFFFCLFFCERGERIQIALKAGHHRRFAGGPMMTQQCWPFFQGIRTSTAKKPYIFVIFQGGGRDPLPPLWNRACKGGIMFAILCEGFIHNIFTLNMLYFFEYGSMTTVDTFARLDLVN